jgi:hypothetical protein
MRTVAMVGLLLLAVVAIDQGALRPPAADAQAIPGATYTGTHSGGGTVEFTVSIDGTGILSFSATDIRGDTCTLNRVEISNVNPGVTIAKIENDTISYTPSSNVGDISLSGSFPSPGTAQGTLSYHDPGTTIPGIGRQPCSSATLAWSASASGAAPVPAQSPAVLQQQCSTTQPGTVLVTFSWQPSGAGSQWLDLSLLDNGFAPGTIVGVGPLPADASTFAWDGLVGGMTHYVRINTLTPAGWVPSQTLAFTTGVCGGPAALGEVTQACGGQQGTVDETFRWNTSAPLGSVQWLDLSLVDNGFAPGTFVSAGPLDPAATSFAWTELRSGLTHYWRVNTLTPTGWQPSSTGSFVTGSCPPPSSLGPISINFTATRPPGSFTGTPFPDAKLYFFVVSGFDLDAVRTQLIVTLAGPKGPVPDDYRVWQWVEGAPSAVALFLFPGLPAGSYTVTVKLPDGRTASASFTHHP